MADWGAHSEYGELHEVLLCPPDHFRWRETSAISAATLASGASFDPAAAGRQHAELVAALEQAEVRCHFLNPDATLPYQVFARDSSVMTPWGPLVTQMHQSWRRGEYAAVLDFYESADIAPWRMITAGALEGGDVVLVAPGVALIGAGETRTEWVAAQQLSAWLGERDWEVRVEPIPQRFVHVDVIVCMVAEGLAVVCRDIASAGLVDWLGDHGIRTLDASIDSAFGLGVNVLALGRDRVVSAAGSVAVNAALRAEGLTVLDPELSAFTAGGGGPHCLTQALRRA